MYKQEEEKEKQLVFKTREDRYKYILKGLNDEQQHLATHDAILCVSPKVEPCIKLAP